MLMLAFTIFISVPIRNVLVTDPVLDRDPESTLFFGVFENFKSFFYPFFTSYLLWIHLQYSSLSLKITTGYRYLHLLEATIV
jgi:hypothetical protein